MKNNEISNSFKRESYVSNEVELKEKALKSLNMLLETIYPDLDFMSQETINAKEVQSYFALTPSIIGLIQWSKLALDNSRLVEKFTRENYIYESRYNDNEEAVALKFNIQDKPYFLEIDIPGPNTKYFEARLSIYEKVELENSLDIGSVFLLDNIKDPLDWYYKFIHKSESNDFKNMFIGSISPGIPFPYSEFHLEGELMDSIGTIKNLITE